MSARARGYSLEDIVGAVRKLGPGDFIKSETAHSRLHSKVWHDGWNMFWNGRWLYFKFAGELLIDGMLPSFKEVGNG